MAKELLIIYTSSEPLPQGNKHTHHYHAIPLAFKGIEPYLALSSFPIMTAAPHSPPQANNPSHLLIQTDTIEVRSGPSSNLPPSVSADEAEPPYSSTASASSEQPRLRGTVLRPEFKEDGIPPGEAAHIISWTDDDVDATDYKNMPDYDPNQEESEYDSTPPPETEIVPSQTLSDPSADTSLVKQYVRIYSSAPISTVEVSGRASLYLFESIPIVCRHNCKSPAPTLINFVSLLLLWLLTSRIDRFMPHSQIPPTPLHPRAAQPPDSPFIAWIHTHNT